MFLFHKKNNAFLIVRAELKHKYMLVMLLILYKVFDTCAISSCSEILVPTVYSCLSYKVQASWVHWMCYRIEGLSE